MTDGDVLVLRNRVEDGPHQPRLADSRLADEEDRLTLAGDDLPPPLKDECQLLVPTHHRKVSTALARFEAAFDGPLAVDPKSPGEAA
jgi:hypothetical protein